MLGPFVNPHGHDITGLLEALLFVKINGPAVGRQHLRVQVAVLKAGKGNTGGLSSLKVALMWAQPPAICPWHRV